MIKEDTGFESAYNPFDAPIPGQSLTDTPGNYPWEHPPKKINPEEILEDLWSRLTDADSAEELIAMLDAGIPVEAIVRVIVFTGFAEGEYNPDVGLVIIEPLMKMVTSIGIRAGIKNLRISLEDLSNKKTIKNIVSLKDANKKAEMAAKRITQEQVAKLPQGEAMQPKGLLAKPEMMEEEV